MAENYLIVLKTAILSRLFRVETFVWLFFGHSVINGDAAWISERSPSHNIQ